MSILYPRHRHTKRRHKRNRQFYNIPTRRLMYLPSSLRRIRLCTTLLPQRNNDRHDRRHNHRQFYCVRHLPYRPRKGSYDFTTTPNPNNERTRLFKMRRPTITTRRLLPGSRDPRPIPLRGTLFRSDTKHNELRNTTTSQF